MYLRQVKPLIHVRVPLSALWRNRNYVMDHAHLDTILTSRQCPDSVVIEERPANVSKQARRCGDIQKNQPCCTLQALGQAI